MDEVESQEPIYRLIGLHSVWRKYAVVEGSSRFLVTRILNEGTGINTVHLLEKAEEYQQWTLEVSSSHSCIPEVERVVPHADGVDLFIAMPLGMTLSTLVHRVGPLRVPIVASILKTISTALSEVHEKGRGHYALNLDRVVLDETGTLTLLDLGLCSLLESIRGPIVFPHPSWEYLHSDSSCTAPEMLRNTRRSQEVDVFSISAMAFHLLTGSSAYVGGDQLEVYSQVRTGNRPNLIDYRREMNPKIGRAITTGLSPHAHERPSSVSEWAESAFGELDRLDVLSETARYYESVLNDWFYDAYFKTIGEPAVLDPFVSSLLKSSQSTGNKQPLEMVFETMRTTRDTRERSGKMMAYFTGFAVLFASVGLALLYFFIRR